MMGWRVWSLFLTGWVTACAWQPVPLAVSGVDDAEVSAEPVQSEVPRLISPAAQQAARVLFKTPESARSWEPFVLPGKLFAPFDVASVQGRPALAVSAARSVSILRQRMDSAPVQAGRLAFAWKIDGLPPGADLADAQKEDSPVRVVLAFDGDRALLSPRTNRLSELTRLLTGEPLPYASLVYVWSNTEPVGTVVVNPRTDRIRKLVVDSGPAQLGRWRDHERDVHADFLKVFGEPPGPLLAVALMTDTDNTQSQLNAWYGALTLQPRVAADVVP